MKYTILQTAKFSKWIAKLRDRKAKQQIFNRIESIQFDGNFGNYKPLGDGLYELKIATGKGYRAYYTHTNDTIVLLLLGGDKQNKKQQQIDIATAKLMIKKLEKTDE